MWLHTGAGIMVFKEHIPCGSHILGIFIMFISSAVWTMYYHKTLNSMSCITCVEWILNSSNKHGYLSVQYDLLIRSKNSEKKKNLTDACEHGLVPDSIQVGAT